MGLGQQIKQVLIADDSESSLHLLRVILHRCGCRVIAARDGEEALENAFIACPDLFILDLNMPKKDGYTVAAELRKAPAFGATPIVALSAGLSERDEERLRAAGFTLYLSKPIAPAKLRDHIFQILWNDCAETDA